MQTVCESAQNIFAVVETKIELDSHVDTCVTCDFCIIVHDYNRPVNVFGYNSKAGLRHTCIVNAAIAYTEHETGQVVILLINQVIEMRYLDHNHLFLMKCYMDGVFINEVP